MQIFGGGIWWLQNVAFVLTIKAQCYVPPNLTLKNSMFRLQETFTCFESISEKMGN